MVPQCEYRGHRRFPPLTGQLFIVIFPQPVMSWTASTPSDGSLEGLTLVRRELQRRQPPGVKPAEAARICGERGLRSLVKG